MALPPAAPGDPDAEAVGCWERALRCYRRAAETAEGAADRAEATAWVAHALNDLRRHGEAIAVLESLPEEPDLPQDVRLQVEVAWALGLGWSGELDRALEHAERAIAIEPPGGTAFALEMRARIHAAHGRPRAAAADMIARAERVAGDPHLQAHCLYGAARALDEAGDTREAFDRISQALRVLESNALEAPPAVRDLRRDLLARRG